MLAQITDALRRGETAAALAAARNLVASEPGNADARHLLGVCLQRSGDLTGARAAFEEAIAASPDHAEYYFSLATLVLAEGDTPAAIRRLHEALVLDPNQFGAYVMLLHLALARGDLAEAQRNLKLAQRVAEDHPQVKVAEGYLLQAQGDADGALRCFTTAATAAPNLAAAQLALGTAYLGRGMWPFAEQALNNAMSLDPSRSPATLRSLVEARRRQGKRPETLAALDELLALVPDDLVAHGLRAEILMDGDEADAALPDLEFLLDRRPAHAATLMNATNLLARAGRGADALDRAEAALAQAPEIDDLWRVRLNLTGLLGEDAKEILDRWQEARPDSADVLDMLAGYHQARGEWALAETYADRALAQQPDLQVSNSVKLREELAGDPEGALARAHRLLPAAPDAAARRTLLGWAGAALDALGRHDEAAASWREMLLQPIAHRVLPPSPLPADQAPAGEGTGTLILCPPGVRGEFVLRSIKPMLGTHMRMDRLHVMNSSDGFGSVRFPPGHAEAGSAQRWRDSLAAVGLEPEKTVDFLTFFDGYTLEALRGAHVVALLVDPRDALLNWMVHGSLQNFLFSNVAENSAAWLATTLHMLADHRDQHPGDVQLIHLDGQAGDAAAQLESALHLPQPLPALFGSGGRFPIGHWRRYRQAFAKEFAMLEPVAVRLGYPVE